MAGIVDSLRQAGYSDADIQRTLERMGMPGAGDFSQTMSQQDASNRSPLLDLVSQPSLSTNQYGLPQSAAMEAHGQDLYGAQPQAPTPAANEKDVDTKDDDSQDLPTKGGGGAALEGALASGGTAPSANGRVQDYASLISPEKLQAATDQDARLKQLAALSKSGSLIGNFYGSTPQTGGADAIASLATNVQGLQNQAKTAEQAQGLVSQQASLNAQSPENIAARKILAKYYPGIADAKGFDDMAVLANPTLSKLLATNPEYKSAMLNLHQQNLEINKGKLELGNERTNLAKERFSDTSQAAANLAQKNKVLSGNMQALADKYKDNYDAMPNIQVYELATGVARLLGGGVAAQDTIKHLVPRSFQGTLNGYLSQIQNQPRGAGQGEFVKNLVDLIKREGNNANKTLSQIEGRRRQATGLAPLATPDMQAKIDQARSAGYSDDEIQEYLKDAGEQ